MGDKVSPVVLVPGITGSALHDEYELPPEAVWTVLKHQHERITPHPANQRYELSEPARITAGGPFPMVYEELIEELRDELSEDQEGPVPVFPFGYDWRMPLDWTEERLAAFVEEVIERTLLMKPYRNDPVFCKHPTVSLVGHSMGGLIIAGYVERSSGLRVDKVVTLATPFQGSYEAVLRIVAGTSLLGFEAGKARERQAARLTPALYHLLPSFGGLIVDERVEADPFRLFYPDAWQPSVVKGIEKQVSDWGISDDVDVGKLFRAMLNEAKAHRNRISQVIKNDWLAIVGVDSETRVALKVKSDNGMPQFLLRSEERRNFWNSNNERCRYDTGDGVVPLRGAIPPFLDESRIVCVIPKDFGYWEEWRDRALAGIKNLHALLPTMNMLHRLIIRFLLQKEDGYDNTWGRPLPGVEKWNPPLELQQP